MKKEFSKKQALRIILFFGVVSLFADVTYEGARSITGPFLELLGAGAATVGIVIGFGELIGYGLRFVTGWLADRTGWYWIFIILGYGVNVAAIPLLGLAESWKLAAALIVTERLGKAIRTPARDAVMSQATSVTGHGKGFGIHEAMDQIGAVLGPTIVSGVFFWQGTYSMGFAVLAIPAVLSMISLIIVRINFPDTRSFSQNREPADRFLGSSNFTYFLTGVGLVALGFADFPLLAYHFKFTSLVSDRWIPLMYAMAMGVDAVAGLGLGTLFDQWKRPVLIFGVVLTACFGPFVFLGGWKLAIVGVVAWGIGMGMIESVFRASVAELVSSDKRGWAYGLFNGVFGLAWFVGSSVAGMLYEVNIISMVIFLVLVQLLSIPFFCKAFAFDNPA